MYWWGWEFVASTDTRTQFSPRGNARHGGEQLSLVVVAVGRIEIIRSYQHSEDSRLVHSRQLAIQYSPPQMPHLITCMVSPESPESEPTKVLAMEPPLSITQKFQQP
jgi:hypothetical protein